MWSHGAFVLMACAIGLLLTRMICAIDFLPDTEKKMYAFVVWCYCLLSTYKEIVYDSLLVGCLLMSFCYFYVVSILVSMRILKWVGCLDCDNWSHGPNFFSVQVEIQWIKSLFSVSLTKEYDGPFRIFSFTSYRNIRNRSSHWSFFCCCCFSFTVV